MPIKDKDKADEQGAQAPDVNSSNRIRGAQLINGRWHDADGVLLSAPESRLAHQAADKAAAEAKRRAMLGGE